MRETLLSLHRLQQIDLSALEFEKSAEQIPLRIQELERGAEVLRTELGTLNTEIEAQRAEVRAGESQTAEDAQKVKKWKRRLNDIKTPREYQALSREVEGAERSIRMTDERTLETMELVEAAEAVIKEKVEALRALEMENAGKVRELRQRQAQLKVDAAEASKGRDAIIRTLPAREVKIYERLRVKRQGMACALTSRGGGCTGCNVDLRPQLFVEIRRLNSVQQCPNCSRILVLHTLVQGDDAED